MAKMTRRDSLVLLSGALFAGCNWRFFSPTAPSGTSGLPWSPFIGIHASGEAHEAYQETLPLLIRNRNLRGARVEIVPREGLPNQTIKMIGLLGVELVGLVNNEYLFDPNIEARIDEIYAAYPEISYFQIGNEVTNFTSMSLVQYMVALRRVYDHTQRNYLDRNIILITQSPFGSCRSNKALQCGSGALELQEMTSLGLREMSNQKLIIGINVYSQAALVEYANAIRENLGGYRVFVMETGVNDRSQHIQFVQVFYPQFRTSLRAERIYFYAAWVGDSGPEGEHGLIGNVLNPPLTFSPLFNVLAGVAE